MPPVGAQLKFSCKIHAVRYPQHCRLYTGVRQDEFVQVVDDLALSIARGGPFRLSVPQHIIHSDDSTRAEELETGLVIFAVIVLIALRRARKKRACEKKEREEGSRT